MSENIYLKLPFIFFFITLVSCTNEESNSSGLVEREITSIKTFGGSKNETANEVISTADGGYAVFGFTQSNDNDIIDKTNESYDYWLLKFNQSNQFL